MSGRRAVRWCGEMGWGSRGGQYHIHRPAGLGLATYSGVWMPMWISSKGFELAAWNLLVLEPRVGIVGILLGTGVWYQRPELKPRQGFGGPFCHALSWSLNSNKIANYRPAFVVVMLALLFLIFLSLSDLALDSICEKELSRCFLGAKPSSWHLRNGFTEEWCTQDHGNTGGLLSTCEFTLVLICSSK